jgi:hypothetical protein
VTRFRREAIWGLNLEAASLSPKDDGLDEVKEVNEAVLLALSHELFSSVSSVRQMADSPYDMRSRRHCLSSALDSLHFTVTNPISSLGSSQALRESAVRWAKGIENAGETESTITKAMAIYPGSQSGLLLG